MALVPEGRERVLLNVRFLSSPIRLPDPLNLAVGECVAVTGASGSGKSLFLRALADLDPNDAVIELDGVQRSSFAAPAWRRQVTYVPAESGWWAERVRDHFCQEDMAALVPMLQGVGLDATVLDWDVMRLSTGERQRLALHLFSSQTSCCWTSQPQRWMARQQRALKNCFVRI